MNLKTGIVVLVLLALCFFVGVGNGLLRTNDPSAGNADPPNWAKNFEAWLPRGKVTFDDISSNDNSCLNPAQRQLTLLINQTCTYTLSAAFLPRSLKLATIGQVFVTISQPVKEDGTRSKTDEKTLVGTGTFRISSRQSKNDVIQLIIVCQSPTGPCVLQIL